MFISKKNFHFVLSLIIVMCLVSVVSPLSVFAESTTSDSQSITAEIDNAEIISTLSKSQPIEAISTNNIDVEALNVNEKNIKKLEIPSTPATSENKKNSTPQSMLSALSYSQPSLYLSSSTENSITVHVTFPSSGTNGNGLYYYDYSTQSWVNISNTWYTTDGYYTADNLDVATTYYFCMIWYTDESNSWLQRSSGYYYMTSPSSTYAAEVTIFSDPSPGIIGLSSGLTYDLGTHSFITVKNISSSTLRIGNLTGIATGKTMSLGTWSNTVTTEHNGLWYNLEAYKIYNNSAYGGRVSLSKKITSTDLDRLNTFIINNDAWAYTNPCSSFACIAWNTISTSAYMVNFGIPSTPKNLADSIRANPLGYSTYKAVPWDYIVYYANGTGTPSSSSVFN